MIEKLMNCPNCAGVLNDAGRCEFCGSKVYDFCDIDLSFDVKQTNSPTYLRIKTKEGIWTVPVYAQCCDISYKPETCPPEVLGYPHCYKITRTYPEIELHFMTIGEGSYIKDEKN